MLNPRRSAGWRWLWAAPLAAACLAVACTPSGPAATSEPSTTSTTEGVKLTEEQKAELLSQGVLMLSDVAGNGWQENNDGRSTLDADTFSFLLQEPSCGSVVANIGKNQGVQKAQSSRFATDRFTGQNSITLFDRDKAADKLVAQLSKSSSQECLDKAFDAGFRREHEKSPLVPGATISSVRVRKLPYTPLGDIAVGFEVTIDFAGAQGAIETLNITRYAVQAGPTVIDFTFSSKGYSFPDTELFATPVVDRVDEVLHPAGRASTTTTEAPAPAAGG